MKGLPDNALDLTSKKALSCCDWPHVEIDRAADGMVIMRCHACGKVVQVKSWIGRVRRKNRIKTRQRDRRQMADLVDELIHRWNIKVITGLDEP